MSKAFQPSKEQHYGGAGKACMRRCCPKIALADQGGPRDVGAGARKDKAS
jgi:hypothetical protein